MERFEKLLKLISLCKGSVMFFINEHRDCYLSVQEYLESKYTEYGMKRKTISKEEIAKECDITLEVLDKMIEYDSYAHIIIYPYTPIGSIDFYHWSLEEAINNALKELERIGIE